MTPATLKAAPPSSELGGGVRLTPGARRRLRELLADRDGPVQAVFIRVTTEGADLALVDRTDVVGPEWVVTDSEPALAWLRSADSRLDGALVDLRDGGFEVRPAFDDDESFAAAVREALENGVNPLVASHGGRVRLVTASEGVVRIRMDGGCQGCTSARETLVGVVVRHLEHAVPGIRDVIDATDHAAGVNPFFGSARPDVTMLPVLPDEILREACG